MKIWKIVAVFRRTAVGHHKRESLIIKLTNDKKLENGK